MSEYTPIINQYINIKNDHKDKVLFFRLGDFYEFFFEDAKEMSILLGLTLTQKGKYKGKKIPMSGFPKSVAQNYISKLIKLGKKIAICEQIEKKNEKGLIKRSVVKIITPGTFIEDEIFNNEENRYICSIINEKEIYGISFLNITTGHFFTNQVLSDFDLQNEIDKITPVEIIILNDIKITTPKNIPTNKIYNKNFNIDYAIEIIKKKIKNIDKTELINFKQSTLSAGFLLKYIIETKNKIKNINNIEFQKNLDILYIDHNSRKNLEIFKDLSGNEENSLFKAIDNTNTPMGKKLLKNWLTMPITKKNILEERFESVSTLKKTQLYIKIEENLKKISDLDKNIYNIMLYSIKPIDLKKFQISLENIIEIKNKISNLEDKGIKNIYLKLNCHHDVINLIKNSISDNPPISIKDGNVIKYGYDNELDLTRNFLENINHHIIEYENLEKKNLDYKNLKIKFNNKDGYFIDLPNKIKNIPYDYKKIKSLSNCTRYTNKKLEELEKNILISKNKKIHREKRIYMMVIYKIKKHIKEIKESIKNITFLDLINCFAKNSSKFNWTKPEITNEKKIEIKNGRHLIIEKNNMSFIPNNLNLNTSSEKTIIITGANMGGKSTYMRQNAIIILLAHIGSHVPAENAIICKIDKILTRIGANDDISNSCSTFMMEMKEVTKIIETCTENSLVLIDEIGRGTNYFEGKALAISILNELTKEKNPFILFSTHFNDIYKFIKNKEKIKNIFFKVEEINKKIIFFYKWENGISENSFGIQIAELAGIKKNIIDESKKYLNLIKKENTNNKILKFKALINKYNIDLISPKEALNILYLLKELLKK